MAIRKCFWWNTDIIFKSASNNYISKLNALRNNSIKGYDSIPDYQKAEPVNIQFENPGLDFSKQKAENLVKKVSAVFRQYPDILSGKAYVYAIESNYYMVNTEGSTVIVPLNLIAIRVSARIKTNGEQFN
ncbi:MAG: hypothetical protein HC906_14005 [Bacteroidales bacterium]|nr:hypothetical protein [Bacteroidales bacterium]